MRDGRMAGGRPGSLKSRAERMKRCAVLGICLAALSLTGVTAAADSDAEAPAAHGVASAAHGTASAHAEVSAAQAEVSAAQAEVSAAHAEAAASEAEAPAASAEEKFAEIINDVADPAALGEYLDPAYTLSYDFFSGTGEIADGKDLAAFADGSRPIDRIVIKLQKIAYLQRNTAGKIDVIPAIRIYTLGAYRPYIESAVVEKDGELTELPMLMSSAQTEKTNVLETDILQLTEEAGEDLAGCRLVLSGADRNYTIQFGGADSGAEPAADD